MARPKRQLTDISFDTEKAHVALVLKQQGGPANNCDYALVLKQANRSPEFIQKMQEIQVTMTVPDFLQKFFGLWYEDAQILAQVMGYVPPTETVSDSNSYEDYIKQKVESFVVLKSLHDSKSLIQDLSKLDETQYLTMLKDQQLIEKALAKVEKESGKVAKVTKPENSTNASVEKVEPTGSEVTKSKEEKMTLKTEGKTEVEMIEKSALVDIQKALDANKEELQKARDIIAQFEQEKKELVIKSKTAQFAVVKDEAIRAPIVKAALSLESEDDFTAFLAAITTMQANVETSQGFIEKSALFQEQGATVDQEVQGKESAVARILKAKLAK